MATPDALARWVRPGIEPASLQRPELLQVESNPLCRRVSDVVRGAVRAPRLSGSLPIPVSACRLRFHAEPRVRVLEKFLWD